MIDEQNRYPSIKAIGSDRITVSVGMSSLYFNDDSDDDEKLLKRADDALYISKNNGRNRVSTIPETTPDKIRGV